MLLGAFGTKARLFHHAALLLDGDAFLPFRGPGLSQVDKKPGDYGDTLFSCVGVVKAEMEAKYHTQVNGLACPEADQGNDDAHIVYRYGWLLRRLRLFPVFFVWARPTA